MSVAKGNFCGDFPQPKSSISWSPFFSKYSGYNRSYSYDQGGYSTDSYGGGYNGYDPRIYGGGNDTGGGTGGYGTGGGGTDGGGTGGAGEVP